MSPSKQPLAPAFQKPAPLRSRQPFAAIWTLFSAVKFLTTVPFLLAYFLFPSNRGTPKRTLQQEMTFAMVRALFKWQTITRWSEPSPRVPPKGLEDRFVLVDPAKASCYQGVASDPFVKPGQVPGLWYPRFPNAADLHAKQRVLVQFHGGAYYGGTYMPELSEVPDHMFAKTLSAPTQIVYSWLSLPGTTPRSITSYSYLLRQGVKPQNIIVFGNSSGGHMALNLLRYILEHPSSGLPTPAAITASSPWGDLVRSNYDSVAKRPSYKKDYLEFTYVEWGRESFPPPGVDVAEHPYLSLLHHPFSCGDVPIWLAAGADEVVFHENYTTAQSLTAIPGNKVEFYAAPDSPHDLLWTAPRFGFMKEAQLACDKLGEFLRKHGV